MGILKNISIQNTSRSYPWVVVGLLSVVGCLNYLDRMMITTMRFSIVESIPMTDAQFGLLTSMFLWIYGFLSPVGGFLADRFKRTWVIIGSLLVWSVVTWLTSYVTTYEELLFTRALMGISEACYIPAGLAMIMDYHKVATRSLANGIHMAGIMVGQSLGFVGGWIAETHKWNFAFSIFGIVGVVYAIVLLLTLREAPSSESTLTADADRSKVSINETLRALLGNREYLKTLLLWGTGGVVVWLVVGWLPTYFKEHFNLSQSMAGVYSTGYFHAASLVGVIIAGLLADRLSKKHPKGRIFVPMIGLTIAAPAVFLASGTDSLNVALAGFMVFAFFRVFLDANMMPILTLLIDKKYLATGYGILNLVACVVGGVSLYAGGVVRDMAIDVGLLFKISAVLLFFIVFLLWHLKPMVKKQTS